MCIRDSGSCLLEQVMRWGTVFYRNLLHFYRNLLHRCYWEIKSQEKDQVQHFHVFILRKPLEGNFATWRTVVYNVVVGCFVCCFKRNKLGVPSCSCLRSTAGVRDFMYILTHKNIFVEGKGTRLEYKMCIRDRCRP